MKTDPHGLTVWSLIGGSGIQGFSSLLKFTWHTFLNVCVVRVSCVFWRIKGTLETSRHVIQQAVRPEGVRT